MKVTKESKAYDAIANNPPPKFVKEAEKTGVQVSVFGCFPTIPVIWPDLD